MKGKIKTVAFVAALVLCTLIVSAQEFWISMNNCPPIVQDGEGNTYNTIIIGKQCWMAENLNIGDKIDVTVDQTDNGTIEKYCYDNHESNCDIYGALYQWGELMNYITEEGAQGICPDRWHIPTDGELLVLADSLGGNSNAGGKMKTTGTIQGSDGLWNTPNTGANNESRFSGLPAGLRYYTGGFFDDLGYYGSFWSSTAFDASNAYRWYLDYEDNEVFRNHNYMTNGFSLRCLKD